MNACYDPMKHYEISNEKLEPLANIVVNMLRQFKPNVSHTPSPNTFDVNNSIINIDSRITNKTQKAIAFLHELAHLSGSEKGLNRVSLIFYNAFTAVEECIAQLTVKGILDHFGLRHIVHDDVFVEYIDHWKSEIDDPELFTDYAIPRANEAVAYMVKLAKM